MWHTADDTSLHAHPVLWSVLFWPKSCFLASVTLTSVPNPPSRRRVSWPGQCVVSSWSSWSPCPTVRSHQHCLVFILKNMYLNIKGSQRDHLWLVQIPDILPQLSVAFKGWPRRYTRCISHSNHFFLLLLTYSSDPLYHLSCGLLHLFILLSHAHLNQIIHTECFCVCSNHCRGDGALLHTKSMHSVQRNIRCS